MKTLEEILKETIIEALIKEEGLTKEKAELNYKNRMEYAPAFVEAIIKSIRKYSEQYNKVQRFSLEDMIRAYNQGANEFRENCASTTAFIESISNK